MHADSAGVKLTVQAFGSTFSSFVVGARSRVASLPWSLDDHSAYSVGPGKGVGTEHPHFCILVQSSAQFQNHIPAGSESSMQFTLQGFES